MSETEQTLTYAQARYLATIATASDIGTRPYDGPAKRMFTKLLGLGLIEPVRTTGRGKSSITYYVQTPAGRAALGAK